MTKDNAITVLQKIKPTPTRGDGISTTNLVVTIALDMAIDALKSQIALDKIIEKYREKEYIEHDVQALKEYAERSK